ncbi:hypothetical protein MKZ25_10345 [Solibacillus sp. FSL W7-1464]
MKEKILSNELVKQELPQRDVVFSPSTYAGRNEELDHGANFILYIY